MGLTIRAATAEDTGAIRTVVVDAFGSMVEADIIDRLRADSDALVELVATDREQIIGHIMFSRMTSENDLWAALGPLAVASARQNEKIGDALSRAGIEACRAAGCAALVVLGHPTYYPRFGFSSAAAKRFKGEYDRPAYMAMELQPGALDRGGVVKYARAFAAD